MKAGDNYEGRQLESFLPHRGLNMLVDRIEFFESGGKVRSHSWLQIREGAGDPREIFLVGEEGSRHYSEFFLVEHVALTSAVQIYPFRRESEIAFFSTITSFRLDPPVPSGTPIVADVEPLGNRGPFHRSACTLRAGSQDGPECGYAELMAAIMPPRQEGTPDGEKKTLEKPAMTGKRPVDKGLFSYKDPRMVFADEETAFDPGLMSLTARYLYPFEHPLVPGHFPSNPIMMGVAQWSGLMDCAVWLHHRAGLAPGDFTADGLIRRADGSLVTEVKGLVVRITGNDTPPRAIRTKRIGFRDMVRAGEEIFYSVRIAPAR